MQLDVSAEVILSQLGYSKNDASLQQAEKIINSTSNFDKFSKHIFTLNDHLKKMNAYVALSNKSDYLKIKCDEDPYVRKTAVLSVPKIYEIAPNDP